MEKLFRVCSVDTSGKPNTYLGVFKANSKTHAREIASKHYENQEILTTGFYDAIEIDEEVLSMEKADAVIELINKFDIFN